MRCPSFLAAIAESRCGSSALTREAIIGTELFSPIINLVSRPGSYPSDFGRRPHNFSRSPPPRLGTQVSLGVLHGKVRLGLREIICQVCPKWARRLATGPCPATAGICSSKSHHNSRSLISCARPRGAPRAKSSRSSKTCASATRNSAFDNAITSRPPPATSPNDIFKRYFDRRTHKNGFSPSA